MKVGLSIRKIASAAALLALPAALAAQDANPEGWDEDDVDVGVPTVDLGADAGVALPVADLMAFADPGLALGLDASWWVSDHVSLRADGDVANLEGDTDGRVSSASTPDLRLFHYGVGVGLDVPGRNRLTNPWNLELNVGAGATTFDTDPFIQTTRDRDDLTHTYPNVNAGAEVGRKVTPNLLVSVSGQVYYTFIEKADLAPLSDLRATESLEDGVSLPLTLSVRWDLPPVT